MATSSSTRARMASRPVLQRALHARQLVKFTRPFEDGSVNGYVLAIGPEFFLLALVDDVRFNGFQCLRISDVRGLQAPAKYAAFIEAALKVRGERMPRKPRLKLASLGALLWSANRAFPLVTIHREKVDPDVCHIGRITALKNNRVSLLEIGPDALWDKEISDYSLKEITRVDFGGDYEKALHLVGGAPR
ncbi:MAG TPA: hypothetical protein VGQ61_00310 [Candidatus Angelobacter sp.]|jgi:hypothetical protein|nr:hypothetical protein [Candidatus Angelobacter sp.]